MGGVQAPSSSKPDPPSFLRRAGGTGQGHNWPGLPAAWIPSSRSFLEVPGPDSYFDLPLGGALPSSARPEVTTPEPGPRRPTRPQSQRHFSKQQGK